MDGIINRLFRKEKGGLHEFCPRCEAKLTLQKGYDNNLPYWVCKGCGEMLINPSVETESDIVWVCDECGAMLNIQNGFSEKLGPVVYGNDQSEPFLGRDFSSTPNYSNEVAAEIDEEIRNFVEQGYNKAEEILTTHIDQLHTIAQYLIKHEKIEGPEFEKLMKGESLDEPLTDSPESAET